MAAVNEVVAGKGAYAPEPSFEPGSIENEPLYEKHRKIYPKYIKGFYRSLKTWFGVVLLAIYFVGPWLRWQRESGLPNQAILLDMTHERAYIWGLEIWPQEIFYLAGVLVLGAFGLFFATSLFGRLWCGLGCPQTVFTDLFVAVERLFEGDRNERMRRDRGPWTFEKLIRKGSTVGTWLVISLLTGWTWEIYFNEAHAATLALFHGNVGDGSPVSWAVLGFALGVAAIFFVLAGFAREQFCIYMCPWPRFQAAMYDEDSLVVTYETWRGEPRGAAHKGTDFSNRGHCIECKQCIQVCPTGIDIRDGSQLACIGCALCVDACDNIMTLMNLPTGLITYDSAARQDARAKGQIAPYRFFRGRSFVYAGLMTIVVAIMTYGLLGRTHTGITVQHERAPMWVSLAAGNVRNGYDFKILNKVETPSVYTLTVKGLPNAQLRAVFYSESDQAAIDLPVKQDSVGVYRVYVTAPKSELTGKATDFTFVLTNKATGVVTEQRAMFAGPDAPGSP